MIHSMVVDNSIFRQILAEPDYDNIIVGTGLLAHDVYNKLILLGVKVKCFVGMEADHERNIWHFSELLLLEKSECHHFLMCCETQEDELYHFATLTINRCLNLITARHKQVIQVSIFSIEYAHICRTRSVSAATDALNGKISLCEGQVYEVLGDEDNADAFRIHLVGSCHVRGAFGYFPKSINEFLYDLLTNAGFPCVIYAWGQSGLGTAPTILRLIRDIRFFKIDLLIKIGGGLDEIKPEIVTERNMLPAFTNPFVQIGYLISNIYNSYSGEISNGTNNDIDLISLRKMQHRILITLANLYGFSFWETFLPKPYNYDLSDYELDPFDLKPRYAEKNSSMREDLIASLDSRYLKDYSKAIPIEEDAFYFYTDELGHLSYYGKELIAKLLANDILKKFAKGHSHDMNFPIA